MRAGVAGLMTAPTPDPELPDTEDLAITAVTEFNGGEVVGSTNDNAGVLAVLTDDNDATYLDDGGNFFSYATVQFAEPTQAGVRDIESAVFVVRYQDEFDGLVGSTAFAGISPAPEPDPADTPYNPGGPADLMVGPISPTGGGAWSLAQWNALSCQIYLVPFAGTGRLISALARVTYAS